MNNFWLHFCGVSLVGIALVEPVVAVIILIILGIYSYAI